MSLPRPFYDCPLLLFSSPFREGDAPILEFQMSELLCRRRRRRRLRLVSLGGSCGSVFRVDSCNWAAAKRVRPSLFFFSLSFSPSFPCLSLSPFSPLSLKLFFAFHERQREKSDEKESVGLWRKNGRDANALYYERERERERETRPLSSSSSPSSKVFSPFEN